MTNYTIPFNKPYLTGKEAHYMYDAAYSGKLSGNGKYTQLCQNLLEEKYGFGKCLLTTSCTDALEMAAILINIQPGDEVIVPSFTFVSTANAFVLRGADIIFADSGSERPGLDEDKLEALITPRTRAIVPVHYAGVACNMDKIMDIANRHHIIVVEDAAQAIDSFYCGADGIRRPLGSIGHLAAFSFHETKNIISGEGGMLAINDPSFFNRADIIWEKGTNRSAYFRGEVDKYGWVDIGSSFLPAETVAAFLYAQLENIKEIQNKRIEIWNLYYNGLIDLERNGFVQLPTIPDYATNNAHMFYLVLNNSDARDGLLSFLKENQILAVFHYLSLHKSKFYENKYTGADLVESNRYSDCLVRLPFFFELTFKEVNLIISLVHAFFKQYYQKG